MKETIMFNARTLAVGAAGVLLFAGAAAAQDLLVARPLGSPSAAQDLLVARPLGPTSPAQYRDFALKSDLATVAAAAGVPPSAAKTIHERPALMQDLEWRPSRWRTGSTAASTDPVEQIVFSFYNGQLFRIVVDYARDRTEGLTDTDMVDAIAAVYGTPGKRVGGAVRTLSEIETESGSPVARWGDAVQTIVLYRTSSYGNSFRLIVTELSLDKLARKAGVEAARLEERDAPRLELARQKKERDDGLATSEKARAVNKAVFRP